MAEITLEDLLAKIAAGDRGALETVYRRTSAKLLGVILAVTGDRGAAEDVLQDAYITVWRKAAQYQARRGQPMAWLNTIARNRAIDAVRKTRRRPQIDDAVDTSAFEDAAPNPEDLAIRGGEADALSRCLDELSESYRLCIQLAYWRGYTHSELADLLERPLGTIKSWTRRGLMSLKDCLSR